MTGARHRGYHAVAMRWIAGIFGSAVLALGPAATVAPPPAPGAWHQLSAAMTSRPGKALHFFRTAQDPHALGIVVTSSSARPIHGFWSSYCEVLDDDTMTEQLQGKLTGVKKVVAYPPVLTSATHCYVWVNVNGLGGAAKVAAAEFAY
jgi:hypothetical protein